jgi:hypothetical protein
MQAFGGGRKLSLSLFSLGEEIGDRCTNII